jgi:hypothetical protein
MARDPAVDQRLEEILGRPPNGFERLVYRSIRFLRRTASGRRTAGGAGPTPSGRATGAATFGIDLPTPGDALRDWFCPSCGARRRAGSTSCDACGAGLAPGRVPDVTRSAVAVAGPVTGTPVRPRTRPTIGRGRIAAVLGVVVLSGAVGLVALASGDTGASLPEPVDPRLPDLVMAPIEDVNPSFTGNLDKALRFGARIGNVGAGEFMLVAKRSAPWSNDWVVYQRFREPTGRISERRTKAAIIYGNDSHDHWHVQAVEAHRLERKDTGELVTEVIKQGFCFYDTDLYRPELPGAPPEAIYQEAGCRGPLSRDLAVGLSVGWVDDYPWTMLDQRMAVDDVPDGRYRLHEIADPFDVFAEADESNNETWVDIELVTSGTFLEVRVLDRAPED